ncbi:MAG: molybdate ABC transporter substrate-binding protein [Actinomycetota bacterium]
MLARGLAVVLLSLVLSLPASAEVRVFAAASLTNALAEVADAFTARTGEKVQSTFAASSALARQIEQGAPADVFASADLQWMDWLAGRGLVVPGSRLDLLGNALVLVAPSDSPLDKVELGPKTDVAALAGAGRIATGNPDAVPVGVYFRQAMERSGQWAAVAPKIAATDSVRAALAFVERGEAALGVVYATDAAMSKKVKVVGAFPGTMHDPIVYPFALVAGRANPAAKAFLEYLSTPEAKGVFARYGFKVN